MSASAIGVTAQPASTAFDFERAAGDFVSAFYRTATSAYSIAVDLR